MNILILATDDKLPFELVRGKPIIEWCTRSIPFIGHYDESGDYVIPDQLYFVLTKKSSEIENDITTKLIDIYGVGINIKYVPLEQNDLINALSFISTMNPDESLMILTVGASYNDNDVLDLIVEAMELDESMIALYFDPIDKNIDWPFVYSDGELVTSILIGEPDPFTHGGRPLIGTYWFSSVKLFTRIAKLISVGIYDRNNLLQRIEQILSMYISHNGAVLLHKVDDVMCIRTKTDIELANTTSEEDIL